MIIKTSILKAACKALTLPVTMLLVAVSASSALAKPREYALVINKETVNITGTPLKRITVNGGIPGPTLKFTVGDEAVIRVTNNMTENTSVHWHGLLLPGGMDGVPGMNNFAGIAPGTTFVYRFTIRQDGTYWYHAHSAGQEQDGHYGAIIIHPEGGSPVQAERDYVVLLSDFHEDDGDTIMSNLKKSSEYYAYARRTVGDFFSDVRKEGFARTWENAGMWGEMRMMPTDLADVGNYTFLVNGKTPEQNWEGLFKPGEHIRLRFINASAMSFYDVRIPGLRMTVVSADGQPVEPVTVDEFRFGVAETYDVIVQPGEYKAYPIVAESVDRSGFALATLTPRTGMRVASTALPRHRKRSLLTMADMGMAHGEHEGHKGHKGHGGHKVHIGHNGHAGQAKHAKHNKQTHHAEYNMHIGHDKRAGHDTHANHSMYTGHGARPFPAPGDDFLTGVPGSGWADADTPDGHIALAYKDLRYRGVRQDIRPPQREITVRLGGNMERYIWTLNGKKFPQAKPINLDYGERVRLTFINDTMMAHPMHLHGMFVQLENGQPPGKLPNKHTIIVAPGDTYSALLTADEPGEWAFHCHLLYHMMSGMMNKVVVAKLDADKVLSTHPQTHRPYRSLPSVKTPAIPLP